MRNPRLTAADQKARWRADYDEAVACDFAYCIGHRHVGDTFASWETLTPLQWARRNGVPSKLVAEWEAERRRTVGTKPRNQRTNQETSGANEHQPVDTLQQSQGASCAMACSISTAQRDSG